MTKKNHSNGQNRKPPVHMPLPFEAAVEGLLAVKPRAKKKPATKKVAGKSKKSR